MPLARLLTPLLCAWLLVMSVAIGAAAQVEGSRWTSPTYGFTVSWAGTDWRLDPNGSLTAVGPERLDRIHLINGVSSLYFEGATRYQGDLASCVAEEANLLSRESGVSNIRPYVDETGAELVADGSDSSAAAFTLTLAAGNNELELVDYIECRTLIPGEAVLIITLVTNPQVFEQELAAANAVAETITLAEETPSSPLASYGGLVAAARERPSIAGPIDGELAFGPGTLAVERVGVDAPDFYARVEFENPTPATLDAWDFGLGFRDRGGEEQLRLVVDSDGRWFLKDGVGPVLAQGVLVDIDSRPGGSNIIELVASGQTGFFAFNERLVSALDLSARVQGGDLFAGAGFFTEDAPSPGTTRFRGLEVWSLSTQATGEDATSAPEMNAATFAAARSAAAAVGPLAGPASGDLAPRLGAAAVAPAEVEVDDFVAAATFINPSNAAEAGWDFGIAFREQENGDHYRITVASDGSWEFQIGLQPDLAAGALPALNLAAGARNTIEVVVSGDTAGFSVNGAFVSRLDVSALSGASDVWVGAGFHRAGASANAVTRYEDFTVWPLEPAATEPATPVAPQATPVAAAEVTLRVVALRLHERNDSGIDALAVRRGTGAGTEVSVVARDVQGGEVVAIYEGTCAEPITLPLFLLTSLDAEGRSETIIGSRLGDLADGEHAIAIHRSPADNEVVACGDIPAQA